MPAPDRRLRVVVESTTRRSGVCLPKAWDATTGVMFGGMGGVVPTFGMALARDAFVCASNGLWHI